MVSCHCNSKVRTACAGIFGFLFLAISITLFVILFAFQNTKPATPCAGLWGPVTYLHRGNLSYAQENTYDALVDGSAAYSGANVELDVSVLKDDTVVLFHDSTLERITGVKDTNIKDVGSQNELPSILQEIDGYTYNFTNTIPELRPVLKAICDIDNGTIGIDFDTKDAGAVEESVSALKDSNCNNKERLSEATIWSTPIPDVVTKARKELDKNGFEEIRIGVYMPTGVYSIFGLKFMLKTRVLQGVAPGSSILSLHKTTFDGDAALIQEWVDDGWCLGIYGITPDEVNSYTANYYVIDEGPVFPDLPFGGYGTDGEPKETVYSDNSLASYRWFIAVAVILLLSSLVLIGFTVITCSRERRRATTEEANISASGTDTVDHGQMDEEKLTPLTEDVDATTY